MKKTKIFLMLSLAISMAAVIAQNSPMTVRIPGSVNRDVEYACPFNSVFSQLPGLMGQAYADDVYGWTATADDYTATGPFTTMRFWGGYNGCLIDSPQSFIIRFYQRDMDNPALPGAEFISYTLTVIPQPILIWYDYDRQMDVTFPEPVTLLDGWVSMTRLNPGDDCFFGSYIGWPAGGNLAVYNGPWPNGGWNTSTGATLAFCLGAGGAPPETPVSNWALIIGVILIGTFVIFRFRRLV